MKFLKSGVLLFFMLLSTQLIAQRKSFLVDGTVGSSGITKLYFVKSNFQKLPNEKPQEILVKNGKFNISGEISEPVPVFLSTGEKTQPGTDDLLQFILDEGTIFVSVADKLSASIVKGSKANDDFQKFQKGQAKFSETFARLNAEAQAEMAKGAPQDSLQSKYGPLFSGVQADMLRYQEAFIRQNPTAYISLLVIPQFGQLTQNYIKADSLFNLLDTKVRSGKAGAEIHSHIEKEKKTSIGAVAPDFSLADTAGRKVALSSLKGKYVLLDFWASWCGPCRQENPNVVEAYRTFKDRDFTVFGVSLDREKKNWLKAIKDDELTWGHVSDLKFWSSEAAVLYGITAIPRNFLLDPQGKIIARDLRGPALIEMLNELLKK